MTDGLPKNRTQAGSSRKMTKVSVGHDGDSLLAGWTSCKSGSYTPQAKSAVVRFHAIAVCETTAL
jgi:hypothetical protein